MKHLLLRFSVQLFLLVFISSCEINKAPEFDSVVPADGFVSEQGEVVAFYFSASDPDGEVVNMSLEIDGNEVTSVADNFIDYDWDPGTSAAGKYRVTAIAVDDQGKSAETSIEITLEAAVVITPTDVLAAPYPGRIFVSWDVKVDYTGVGFADSYNLFWTDNGNEPGESSNTINGITSDYYNHEGLDHTKTYKYRVQSVRNGFTSEMSATASASPEPAALGIPQNLAVSLSGRDATLTWDAVSGSGITYKLKRQCVPVDGYFRTHAEDIGSTSYLDADLPPGQGFFYKVSAYDPALQQTSGDSETVYAVTKREVFESERNNEDTPNTLGYDTHWYDAEQLTSDLDWFSVKGGYSGAYSIYSSASYKNFDADCFRLWLDDGDRVEFDLVQGTMSGLWSMSVEVVEYGKSSTGNDREVLCHTFSADGDSFVYDASNTGTVMGCYLKISMWEDLVNTGPYNYEVGIRIVRDL